MPLTVLKVRYAGPGRHADMHGLYLHVRPSGSRSWLLRMQYQGRRRDFGLGPVHDVSLAEARMLALDYRKMVRSGIDPAKARVVQRKTVPSFESVARACYDAMKGGWKDRRNASWVSSFDNHVFPLIGKTAIDAVDSTAVLGVLEPIWTFIPDTARRILQRIGTVLDYAHIKGLVPAEVSLRSVTRGLPRQTRQVIHRAAMPYAEVPAFFGKLDKLPRTVARNAAMLTVLTAVRSNETRFAVWREFDLEAGIWSIPPERMKMKDAHVVPLSAPAVAVLRRMRREHVALDGEAGLSDRLLFTYDGKKPISDTAILNVLRDMGISTITIHGFRSSFTDWTAEQTAFPKEVADKALAHALPNAVEAAYRRTDFFEKRRTLMTAWADFVTGSTDA